MEGFVVFFFLVGMKELDNGRWGLSKIGILCGEEFLVCCSFGEGSDGKRI